MKGVHVYWCMNERCKLEGLPSDESDNCPKCDRPLTRLTWTLIVCTPRGVYMGLVVFPNEMPKEIRAYSVRSAVYYASYGSNGLAVVGPKKGSRITGAAEEMLIAGPISLAAITPKALSAWEDEPWCQ